MRTVPDVNGVKTGYTLDAGNVLVGSAERKGVELVSAVLGAPSESERDSATLTLLDYGFSLYHRRTPVRGRPAAGARSRSATATVRVPLAPTRDLRVTVRHGQRLDTAVRAPDEVDGPVGARPAARPGRRLDRRRARSARAPLAATRAAAAASLLERYDAAVPGPAGGRLGRRDRRL